jgi:hypothetical protein
VFADEGADAALEVAAAHDPWPDGIPAGSTAGPAGLGHGWSPIRSDLLPLSGEARRQGKLDLRRRQIEWIGGSESLLVRVHGLVAAR